MVLKWTCSPTSVCWLQPPNSCTCWICLIWFSEGLGGKGPTVSFVQLSTSLCSSSVNVLFLRGLWSVKKMRGYIIPLITEWCVILIDEGENIPLLAGSEVWCSGLQYRGSLLCSPPEKQLDCWIPRRCRKQLPRVQAIKQKRVRERELIKSLTRVSDSVVIYVRMRPRPELDFGWPGPTRRKGWWRRGKRRGSGQGGRQTLPLVFEGTELSVQLLQLSVLLGLKGYHLFDVPIEQETEIRESVEKELRLSGIMNRDEN